jgi:HEAT repeat protein
VSAPFDTLLKALDAENRFVQAEAARLLGELRRPEAVEALVGYVTRFGRHTKLVGLHALAQIGERRVCPAIRPLVSKPNCYDDWYWYGAKSVRAATCVALLTLGDESGAAYLRELADADEDVFFAWFAPAILRLPDQLPVVADLKSRITVDNIFRPGTRKVRATEPGVITMIAEVLGILKGEAACRKLLELMRFRSRYVRGQAALSLLEASPTAEHVAAVEDLAANDPTDFARLKAHVALARLGQPGSAPRLAEWALSAADPFDRASAVEALGLLGLREGVPLLRLRLADSDAYVRRCAIEALERLDAPAARDAVAKRLTDPDPLVCLQAAKFMAAVEGACRS